MVGNETKEPGDDAQTKEKNSVKEKQKLLIWPTKRIKSTKRVSPNIFV